MFQAIGWIGMVLALVSYWMLTTKRIEVGRMFHLLNLIAVTCLGVSAWEVSNYPIVGLETVWAAISCYGLLSRQKRES